jgi:hypothetical protein
MAVQQFERAVELGRLDGLLREIHVRGVGFLSCVQFAFLRPLPLP